MRKILVFLLILGMFAGCTTVVQPRPRPGPCPKKVWVPGHYNAGGIWVPGRWRCP